MATFWQDVKLVMFLSTMAKPHITTNSHRRVGCSNVLVSTPHIAKLYHNFYKGMDFFGQLCERYDMLRCHYRSWIYFFNFMFNAAVVNSYILFKSTSLREQKKKYGQFDFHHKLALCLINHLSNCSLNITDRMNLHRTECSFRHCKPSEPTHEFKACLYMCWTQPVRR